MQGPVIPNVRYPSPVTLWLKIAQKHNLDSPCKSRFTGYIRVLTKQIKSKNYSSSAIQSIGNLKIRLRTTQVDEQLKAIYDRYSFMYKNQYCNN